MQEQQRSEALDRLAMGAHCPRCGAWADEPCTTRRLGKPTAPHIERIDHAVKLYQRYTNNKR